MVELAVAGARVTLLGTAHVSRASALKVEELIDTGDYDAIAIELCNSRYQALRDPDAVARMDLFKVVREGKVPMITANLALGAFQQRLAEQFGIEPGAEMRVAMRLADKHALPLLLLDREIGTTLRRVYRNIPWWRRLYLLSGLLVSMFSHEEFDEDDIERLKSGDILEAAFAEFADTAGDLFAPLIAERDEYMMLRLREYLDSGNHTNVLAIVGAGHLGGISKALGDTAADAERVAALDKVPPPSPWPRRFAWLVVVLVLCGFGLGFQRSPELGWELVLNWIVINGGLSALGAAIAGAHVLTIAAAFLAAPLTSLNPTVGAGMVTAAVETYLRKPTVGDFSSLRTDTTEFAGWRRNRVARILLVFLFSTLGSAIGTYLAGFLIVGRLSS